MAADAPPGPGWYGDPAGTPGLRYWDGMQWTGHVQSAPPAGVQSAPLATWLSRVGAALLDAVFLLPVWGGYVVARAAGASTAVDVAAYAFALIGGWLYAVLLLSRSGSHNGQTFGKQVAGIRVVRESGEGVTLGLAALRECVIKSILFGFVAALTLFIASLLDDLWPLWDDRNQALHDKMAHTFVVQA